METLSLYVGDKIKTFRKERGMTQTDLAEKLGVSKQTISRYEKGTRKPDQDVLFLLSDIFNVSIDDFFPPTNKQLGSKKESNIENEINLFIKYFTSMSEQQRKNFFKELKNHLQEQGEPTDFLKKTSDILTHLTGLQEENKKMTIKVKKLDEELRIANIAKEILGYNENDIVALNMLKEKYGEEDFNKAIEYIKKLDEPDNEEEN